MTEFRAFPKIPRLFRDVTISEKIDGTNAAVVIEERNLHGLVLPDGTSEVEYIVTAQSRNRIITPESDNFGFARWVEENRDTLIADLGPGYHYGEWWGQGIQRRYGLDHKRFSLFNTKRWQIEQALHEFLTPNLHVVPVLFEGPFDTEVVAEVLNELAEYGSRARPGFMQPEGIIVYHQASQHLFKVTVEHDEVPKAVALKAVA